MIHNNQKTSICQKNTAIIVALIVKVYVVVIFYIVSNSDLTNYGFLIIITSYRKSKSYKTFTKLSH